MDRGEEVRGLGSWAEATSLPPARPEHFNRTSSHLTLGSDLAVLPSFIWEGASQLIFAEHLLPGTV